REPRARSRRRSSGSHGPRDARADGSLHGEAAAGVRARRHALVDQGTLRMMEHFARRPREVRLLWIASFRLTQVIAEDHPLRQLRQELRLHRLCEEIILEPFSESEVAAYMQDRLAGTQVP